MPEGSAEGKEGAGVTQGASWGVKSGGKGRGGGC